MKCRAMLLCLASVAGLAPVSAAEIIVGAGPGGGPRVSIHSVSPPSTFEAYPAGFQGGVRVAAGDVNGDGRADYVTGTGAGAPGGHVKVFDGVTGSTLRSFFAYGGFAGGVHVAAGDLDGDGLADVVTGAGSGAAGGHVKVFDGSSGSETRSFFAFDGFGGGVRVATGDLDGDGRADIIAGAGSGSLGGHVKVFSGANGSLLRSFFAYEPSFVGGVYVAAGDVNGDGFADVITGTGGDESTDAASHVKVFDGQSGSLLSSFLAYAGSNGGVRVASGDLNGDGLADIITGAGPGAGPHVKVFSGADGSMMQSFFAFEPNMTGGVFVAAVPAPGAVLPLLAGLALGARRRR